MLQDGNTKDILYNAGYLDMIQYNDQPSITQWISPQRIHRYIIEYHMDITIANTMINHRLPYGYHHSEYIATSSITQWISPQRIHRYIIEYHVNIIGSVSSVFHRGKHHKLLARNTGQHEQDDVYGIEISHPQEIKKRPHRVLRVPLEYNLYSVL